jgi:hypothetical protein
MAAARLAASTAGPIAPRRAVYIDPLGALAA